MALFCGEYIQRYGHKSFGIGVVWVGWGVVDSDGLGRNQRAPANMGRTVGRPSMIEMVSAHGFYWPAGSEGYCQRYVRRSEDMRMALHLCKRRDVAIQAGGHCGVWPLWLVARFGTVYTFEPDARNFACLSRNVAANGSAERIFAARGLLADGRSPLSISTSKKNIGGHKGKQEPGDIPTFRIDDLRLGACDLIVLDVEGMEVPALMGAIETIDRYRPVLQLEDNELGDRHGWGGREVLHNLITDIGYEIVEQVGKEDIVCVSRT